MGDNILQLILKKENDRKKAIYFLIACILSVIISCKIYGRFVESFQIIPLIDYTEIVFDFFLSGRFVLSLMILIAVYKIFYSFADFILYKWLAKKADILYDFFRYKVKREELEQEIRTSIFLQRLAMWGIKHFKHLSILDIDKNKIRPGLNFYWLISYIRRINDVNDKETSIDLSLAYFPIPIIIQILLIFDTIIIDHFDITTLIIIVVNLLTVIILILAMIVYFVNIFIDLKQDKILNALEKLEKQI